MRCAFFYKRGSALCPAYVYKKKKKKKRESYTLVDDKFATLYANIALRERLNPE